MKKGALILIASPVSFFIGCHNPFNSPTMKHGFETISKMQIRQVMMNIEFFKLQYGHYPDSLGQLNEKDKLVPITDAAQGMQTRKNSYYNYERVGEKYTLFSSGMDGIAGTADDFYPEVDIPDSSRIGLIKKKN